MKVASLHVRWKICFQFLKHINCIKHFCYEWYCILTSFTVLSCDSWRAPALECIERFHARSSVEAWIVWKTRSRVWKGIQFPKIAQQENRTYSELNDQKRLSGLQIINGALREIRTKPHESWLRKLSSLCLSSSTYCCKWCVWWGRQIESCSEPCWLGTCSCCTDNWPSPTARTGSSRSRYPPWRSRCSPAWSSVPPPERPLSSSMGCRWLWRPVGSLKGSGKRTGKSYGDVCFTWAIPYYVIWILEIRI